MAHVCLTEGKKQIFDNLSPTMVHGIILLNDKYIFFCRHLILLAGGNFNSEIFNFFFSGAGLSIFKVLNLRLFLRGLPDYRL